MSRRDWTLFVADMQEACDKISLYVSGMDFVDFCADTRTVDAVVRNLEIIGEASNGISDCKKLLWHQVDWVAQSRVCAIVSCMNISVPVFL
jgi:uncharacterized protein with HEPN domain